MEIRFEQLEERHLPELQAWSISDTNPWIGNHNYEKELLELQKQSPNRYCYVAFDDKQPMGIVDLEINTDKTAWMSLLVRPENRGQGLGTDILRSFLYNPALSQVQELKAEIEKENIASIRCFKKAGFIERMEPETTEGFVFVAKKIS